MRTALWRWLCRSRVQGERLSGFLLVARACLFPLQFFYWSMSRGEGYCPHDDTWLIGGVRYSAELLHQFARADCQVVRIVAREGELVTVEVIEPGRSTA